MLRARPYLKQIFILLGLSYLFFFLGNGILSLTNPDEVFYVGTAREMVQHHSWMTSYLFGAPQFEKPVLTYWLLRIALILFGDSSFGARFFPALFATIGVLAVYWIGLLGFKDEKKAFISALVTMSTSFYIGLARTVFTDMFFSIFILLSLVSFFWGYTERKNKKAGLWFFFVFAGLAVLTKGPLGILIPISIVLCFLVSKGELNFFYTLDFVWGILIFSCIALPWYLFEMRAYGTQFTHEFFYNDHYRRLVEAEHLSNDKWYFYPFSAIASMFPWSLYVVIALVFLGKRLRRNASSFDLFLASWIIVIFLIFQFAHSKLVSYIFPFFPALALAAGDYISGVLAKKNKDRLFFFCSLSMSILLLFLPIGLIAARKSYAAYVPSFGPVFIFAAVLTLYFSLMLFFILKRQWNTFFYLLTFQVPLLLGFAFLMHNDFESFVSSRGACDYLLKNYKVEKTILCSKFFVRGVRYYTDKDVAVIDIGGKGFFSPHPVPYLKTEEKVRDFLRDQGTTYCVLRKSYARDIPKIAGGEFNPEVLKTIGDEYLVKVTRKL